MNEARYVARITAIENFMNTVEKAFPNQSPDVFVNTVQESLALTQSTIRNDINNQSMLGWVLNYSPIYLSRFSSALGRAQQVFEKNEGANSKSFVSCRSDDVNILGTSREKAKFGVKGY
jgi:hypothetical protein